LPPEVLQRAAEAMHKFTAGPGFQNLLALAGQGGTPGNPFQMLQQLRERLADQVAQMPAPAGGEDDEAPSDDADYGDEEDGGEAPPPPPPAPRQAAASPRPAKKNQSARQLIRGRTKGNW
jgi:hypothetical protein